MLHRTAIERVIMLAATGRGHEAQAYLANVVHRGADLLPIRQAIGDACAPEFREPVFAAMPWLAGEAFNPRMKQATGPSLGERLDDAGSTGLALSDVDREELSAIAGEVAEFAAPTGGRPKAMIRWRRFDPQHNPFARQ